MMIIAVDDETLRNALVSMFKFLELRDRTVALDIVAAFPAGPL